MSAGAGSLQKAILETVEVNSPIFYRALMWHLAFERDGIIKTATSCGDGIEIGEIKKSFEENFRRAIAALVENKNIAANEKNFVNIYALIDFLPYLTSRLECYQLTNKLLPSIKKYADQYNGQTGLIHYESYTIEKLSADNLAHYQAAWHAIEELILDLLYTQRTAFARYDSWLNLQLRGRHLFKRKQKRFRIPGGYRQARSETTLEGLVSTLQNEVEITAAEISILAALRSFLGQLSTHTTWRTGAVKDILYTFYSAQLYSKGGLTKEIKDFFLQDQPDLLKSLSGHQEPADQRIGNIRLPMERKFSPTLDKLINRHILRKQKILYLP